MELVPSSENTAMKQVEAGYNYWNSYSFCDPEP